MLTFADQGRGVAQIIAGDLNAEPNEPAMRCLRADYSHEEGHRRHEGRSSSSLLPETTIARWRRPPLGQPCGRLRLVCERSPAAVG